MFIQNFEKVRIRKIVCGIGTNDAPYKVHYQDANGKSCVCPYYQRWHNMLLRVNSPVVKAERPNYGTCTLEPAWHSFMAFRAWMETQDWEGNELDKDLVDQGNKHYGPDTCLFISSALNKLLTLRGNARGPYPLGVSIKKEANWVRYQARCCFYGKRETLGYFVTVEEAAAAYKKAKLAYIAELATSETNPRIKQALLGLY